MQAGRDDALRRLSYIEGHLAGIRKMIQEDRYCVDVIKQTHAVRRAIEKLEHVLLEGHLQHCVPAGIKGDREHEVISELLDLYTLSQK